MGGAGSGRLTAAPRGWGRGWLSPGQNQAGDDTQCSRARLPPPPVPRVTGKGPDGGQAWTVWSTVWSRELELAPFIGEASRPLPGEPTGCAAVSSAG